MRIPAQIQKFRSRSPESVQTAVRKRRKLGVNTNKLFGMRVRQRLKEYGVHYREYARRGSDPEHQAQHRRSGKTQILTHHPDRELEVLPQRLHCIPPPGNDTFETCVMFPVTEDSRRSKRALVSPLLTYSAGKNRSCMVAGRDHGLGRQRREHGLSNCLSACVRFESHLSTLRKSSHRLSFAITRRHSKNEATSLHRLDARTCVRADVSDALLRLVDEPGGEEIVVSDWVVEAGRYAARAAVHLFGGRFVRACDGKVAREGNRAQDNREANDSARRGSFWDGVAFSRAGICAGLSVVAVDGSAARRRSKYPGSFHDADGCVVLGHRRWQRLCGENSHSGGRNYCGGNRGHAHPTALDDAPAEVPAVAHRVLHQRRTHLRSAAAVALSIVSLVGVRLRGSRGGILSVFGLCQAQ